MHISTCEHPVRVFNKYINDYVWTDCRKCPTCRNRRAYKWIQKLRAEQKCWQYCFFFTLTYSDEFIPRYVSNGCELIEVQERFTIKDNYKVIPLDSPFFKSLDTADRNMFLELINSERGINHPSVRDIQLFKKRFNKICYDKYTHKYKNFRSFIVSEVGPTTFRSHYHGIFFFNASEIAQNFGEILSQAWSFGIVDCSPVENKAIDYVAQYVNSFDNLPSYYAHPALKPFYLYSKLPPLGSLFQSNAEIQELFNSGANRRVEFVKVSTANYVPRVVPLSKTIENRLFPKCPQYCNISSRLRTQLYGCALSQGLSSSGEVCDEYESFEDFAKALIDRYTVPSYSLDIFKLSRLPDNISDYFISDIPIESDNELFQLYKLITNDFSPSSYSCLLNLFRLSKRVLAQCRVFGCTLDYYVSRIEKHYDDKERLNIADMYHFQESYKGDSHDLMFMYPEYVYQYDDGSCLDDCEEFAKMKSLNEFIYKNSTKTHLKNAYLESLKVKDSSLYNLIKKYHAEKCHEIVKALA